MGADVMRSIRLLLVASVLLVATAGPAQAAKEYSAERFDSRIRVLADGTLEVTETFVIRFEQGPFQFFFRNVPSRNADDVQIIAAEMDGRFLPFGNRDGAVEVKHGSPVRVQWHFAPRSGTTHTFVLYYFIRGGITRQGQADVLDWPAMPKSHDYRIASSEIAIEHEAPLRLAPTVATRRVGGFDVESGQARTRVRSSEIGRNGWVQPRLEFEAGSVIAQPPQWQQRQIRIAAIAPRWMLGAGLVFAVGMVFLMTLRQGYETPAREDRSGTHAEMLPDTLRPALVGALTSNGSVQLEHAMSTLFTLADRGEVAITESPRKWGHRTFLLRRTPGGHHLAPEEQALLDLVFRSQHGSEDTVTLGKARSRVSGRGFREFSAVVRRELTGLGAFDSERIRVRVRYRNVAILLLIVAALLTIPAGILAGEYGGWPFMIPAAIASAAIAGFIFYGALTPLSNDGVRRAEEWRAFKRHLRDVARSRAHLTTDSPTRFLPFAVALGLAGAWSKFMKHHHAAVPAWFQSLASADDGAFPAFIVAGGAGADGGGGVAVGAGASGGASGAG
jgi:hypothetical protein